jgi:hypothetical protein
MQLAALVAVISYFWRDIWDIVSGSLSAIARRDDYDRSFGLAVGIVIGTIPIGIAGLALAKTLNTCGSPLRSLVVVGLACIVMALLLAIAEVAARHRRPFERVGLLDCDPRTAASRGWDGMRPGRQYRGSWSRVPASSKEATAELSNCQVSRFGRRQFPEIRAASSWAPEAPAVVSATSILSNTNRVMRFQAAVMCRALPIERVHVGRDTAPRRIAFRQQHRADPEVGACEGCGQPVRVARRAVREPAATQPHHDGPLARSPRPGVHIFKVRQSPPSGVASAGPRMVSSSGRRFSRLVDCGAWPA